MRLALAAFLCALALPALGQGTDARRPPLFVLDDGDSRVYLLGSVHVLPTGALPLPAHVEDAYRATRVLAFELDLDAAQTEAPGMVQAATDEETIVDALSPEQLAAVDTAFAGLGVSAGAFHGFEPWFVGMSYGLLALQRSGLSVETGGVDAHFFDRAKADAKERVAFETVALQTAAFDDLSTESQVAFLMASVAVSPDRSAASFEAMVDAWSGGDDDLLAALLNDSLSQPEVFEALLTARNRAWVPQIESLLAREGEDALVVVGAGHLVGERSVVALLREAGYAVARL